jgi:hypothetical protein
MSFSEYEDCFVWYCEGCDLQAEFPRGGQGSFLACVDELKRRGWRISRGSEWGEWHHRCAKCACAEGASILDKKFRSVG